MFLLRCDGVEPAVGFEADACVLADDRSCPRKGLAVAIVSRWLTADGDGDPSPPLRPSEVLSFAATGTGMGGTTPGTTTPLCWSSPRAMSRLKRAITGFEASVSFIFAASTQRGRKACETPPSDRTHTQARTHLNEEILLANCSSVVFQNSRELLCRFCQRLQTGFKHTNATHVACFHANVMRCLAVLCAHTCANASLG